MFILSSSETSSIYYLKLFCVTPAMIFFAVIYGVSTKYLERNGRFNIILFYFAFFYSIFLFVIYPNLENYKLDRIFYHLKKSYPRLVDFWSIIQNWHLSLFYIHAEAWGSFALGIAFWTLANDITTLEQSKRLYSLLAIFSNIGGMLAGISLSYIFKGNYKLSLSTSLFMIFLVIGLFNFLIYDVKVDTNNLDISSKSKIKMSFFESVKYIFKSDYVIYIALIIISYGLCISLFEAIWKDNLRLYASGNNNLLAKIYGQQITYIGLSSIILSLIIFPIIIKRGWKTVALFTPICFLCAVIIFVTVISLKGKISFFLQSINISILGFSVILGLISIIIIKACKFSFFDTSKEAAYIPLDENAKIRSKAAVDGVGLVFGKGLGAILVTGLSFILNQGINDIKYLLFLFILIFLLLWFFAIKKLYSKKIPLLKIR